MLWLLDLQIGGKVYRFSQERVIFTSGTNEIIYQEGLSKIDINLDDLHGTEDIGIFMSISSDIDWAFLAKTHPLDLQPGKLTAIKKGSYHDQVSFYGLTEDVIFGSSFEPLELTIKRSFRDNSRNILSEQARVTTKTQPIGTALEYIIPETNFGDYYPLIIGYPGFLSDNTARPVVPVVKISELSDDATSCSTDRSLVAWIGDSEATEAYIWRDTDIEPINVSVESWDVLKVKYNFEYARVKKWKNDVSATTDKLGQKIMISEMAPDDAQVYAGFCKDYGGGITYKNERMRGLGNIIDWVLTEFCDVAVDYARLEEAKMALNVFKIDTYIDTEVNAFEWINSIIEHFPVVIQNGNGGIFPKYLPNEVSRNEVTATVIADNDLIRRVSRIFLSPTSEIVNEVTVRFGYCLGKQEGFLFAITVTAQSHHVGRTKRRFKGSGTTWTQDFTFTTSEVANGLDPMVAATLEPSGSDTPLEPDYTIFGNPKAARSQTKYGIRPLEIEANYLWDANTAIRMAESIIDRQALPKRRVSYFIQDDQFKIGQVISLTDSEVSISDEIAVITDIRFEEEGIIIDLELEAV